MKLRSRALGGLGLFLMTTGAYADVTFEQVKALSPRMLALAYAEIVNQRYDFRKAKPMSFTSIGALRDYIPQDQWDGGFKHATLAGWERIHDNLEKFESVMPDFIGSYLDDIETLSLFDQFDVKLLRWTFSDAARARALFDQIAVMPFAESLSDDVIALRPPGGFQSDVVFVAIEDAHLTVGVDRAHLPTAMTAAAQDDPNITFFHNSYMAMLQAAYASVPEGATIMEVAIYSWGNVEKPTRDLPFPQNIVQDAQFEGTNSAPFHGIAAIDWRLPGQEIGVSLAFNHLDACDAASGFPALMTERWDSFPVQSDILPAQFLPVNGAFTLVETDVAGTTFCATVIQTQQVGYAEPAEYGGPNQRYQMAYVLFNNPHMTTSMGFFDP